MDKTLRALEDITRTIRKGNANYTEAIVSKVASEIRGRLLQKGKPALTKNDVKSIRMALIVDDDENSRLTWRRHDCFNAIVHKLKVDRLIDSPYINTMVKMPRYVLSVFDRHILDAIRALGALRKHLLEFSTPTSNDPAIREKHYYCAAYAACVIFGQMTFPSFHKKIFSLKKIDFAVDPAYFKFKFDSGDTYCNYFLPAPAAIHVQRLLRFQANSQSTSAKKAPPENRDMLFTPQTFEPGDFPSIFSEWLKATLASVNSPLDKHMNLSVFSRAAIAAEISDYSGSDMSGIYPPFVLAVQSRRVQSFSYADPYLPLLLGGKKKRIDHCPPLPRMPKHAPFAGMSSLDYAISDVGDRITLLKTNKLYKMSDRNLAADDLLSILDNHKPSLSETDFENLGFYVRWLCSILRDRSMKIGRICSFLSSVPVFLDALSDEGIICKLSKSEFTEIAASTMSLYYAPGIRSAIKKFSEYVKFECEDFDMPDWQYTKELFKKNIPSPKPLIDYSDIKSVIALMNLRAALFGCPDCEYIKIFIYLGVYAGMRVMEIANLRLHNVIYDDGIVICVRATKTENGVRNIHLSKLAPAWVVDAFLAYFKGRRGSCTDMNDLIFVQSNGEPLVTKQVSSRVAKYFKDGGMANIRFHFLRHQFQNFFMLRWIYAFHPDVIPPDAPFLQFELFDKANIENFKKYFLGLGDVKRGQEQFTHALAVLSRTVGHAFCSVTESAYLHNIAWLFYLLSKRWDKKDVSVTTQQMQDLLQLSYYKLPDQFKGRGKKTFKQGEIVQAQSLDLKPFYKTGLSKTNKG